MKNFCRVLSGLLLLSFATVGQVSKKTTYEINGSIKGLNNDRVYMVVAASGNSRKSDTLVTKGVGDKFKFVGNVPQQPQAALFIGDVRSRKMAYFYLEPGKIDIKGNADSLDKLSVTGTITNNERNETNNYLSPIYARIAVLGARKRIVGENHPESRKLDAAMDSKKDSIDAYTLRFMETHLTSKLSPIYLYILQDKLPTQVVERFYNSFSSEWQNSQDGQSVYSKLQANKSVAVGMKAPDFTSTDTSGVKVKLSDFKGKYVLLEFWANWCVPCRALNPHLKTVYSKFKDKGFTIVQYSLDVKKDEQKWKDAIKQDGLPWTQVCDLQKSAWGGPVTTAYGVQPIPDSFLISPDGTILGRRLSPKALEEELSKVLN